MDESRASFRQSDHSKLVPRQRRFLCSVQIQSGAHRLARIPVRGCDNCGQRGRHLRRRKRWCCQADLLIHSVADQRTPRFGSRRAAISRANERPDRQGSSRWKPEQCRDSLVNRLDRGMDCAKWRRVSRTPSGHRPGRALSGDYHGHLAHRSFLGRLSISAATNQRIVGLLCSPERQLRRRMDDQTRRRKADHIARVRTAPPAVESSATWCVGAVARRLRARSRGPSSIPLRKQSSDSGSPSAAKRRQSDVQRSCADGLACRRSRAEVLRRIVPQRIDHQGIRACRCRWAAT